MILADAQAPSAIHLLATHLIHVAVIDGGGPPEWEDYPEIGENDWRAILAQVAGLTQAPPTILYTAAYNLLTARSNT